MSEGHSTIGDMNSATLPISGHRPGSLPEDHYDPWLDLQQNWPGVRLLVEPMDGDLLGEVRDDGWTIAVRAGTSAAQRRCTLAHEIVHLERGLRDCGRWLDREELAVHSVASQRLVRTRELITAMRDVGGASDRAALAQCLDVDSETLGLRLAQLSRAERQAVRRALARAAPLWSLA